MWVLRVSLNSSVVPLDFRFDERMEALDFMVAVLEDGVRYDGSDGRLVVYPPAAIGLLELYEDRADDG